MRYPLRLLYALWVMILFPFVFIVAHFGYFIYYLKFSKDIPSPFKASGWEVDEDEYKMVQDGDDVRMKCITTTYATPIHWAFEIVKSKQ